MQKRLEIGPARPKQRRRGWDTLDSQPGCTFCARWGREPLPFGDAAYDYVLASHVLEHVPWFHAQSAIAEVFRVLKFDGCLELWVPDFAKIVAEYLKGSILNDGWYPLNPERDKWKSLNGRIFWGARRGEVGQEQHFHHACFDEASLSRLLKKAGFRNVRRKHRKFDKRHGLELGMLAYKRAMPSGTARF